MARAPEIDPERILERGRRVLEVEAHAVLRRSRALGDPFVALVTRLLALDGGRLAVTGVGKSGLIGEKIAATLSSTGTPSFFLRPVEALHGDLGMLAPGDVLLAISNSGETNEVLAVVEAARALGVEVVALTGGADSSLARAASITVDIGVEREACPLDLAPTASTTVTLAVGDALAMVLLEERGFTRDHYARFHPGGSLGQRLRFRVEDLHRSGAALPIVREGATLGDALHEMTAKANLGITLVVGADESLLGVVTDGDVRRAVLAGTAGLDAPVAAIMGRRPKTIDRDASVAEALQVMEAKGITALAVVDVRSRPVGVIHLHDILGRGKVVF